MKRLILATLAALFLLAMFVAPARADLKVGCAEWQPFSEFTSLWFEWDLLVQQASLDIRERAPVYRQHMRAIQSDVKALDLNGCYGSAPRLARQSFQSAQQWLAVKSFARNPAVADAYWRASLDDRLTVVQSISIMQSRFARVAKLTPP